MVHFVYLALFAGGAEVVSCLGSLFSRAVGEGGALQTNITGVCGEHSQCSGHPGFVPAQCACATLLTLPAALQGAGPVRRAVPVFGSSTKAQTRLGLHFVPSLPKQLRQPGA